MSIPDVGNVKAASYKARKEAFVSNLSGSSLTDINTVTLVAPAAILLWAALQRKGKFFTPYGPVACVLDFLLNVCAVLFAFTAYSSVPLYLNLSLAVPAVLLLLPLRNGKPEKTRRNNKAKEKDNRHLVPPLPDDGLINRPFLTHYRGAMLIATTIAILAVDFPIFPRRFAKVETWGTSLMDLGVGSFVFSGGVVSARNVIRSRTDKTGALNIGPSLGRRLLKTTRHSLPLFVLGIARLISVKNLDYAEHVTEYGVHWNFFFTLGLLPPFVELADTVVQAVAKFGTAWMQLFAYGIVAIVIALCYEIVLNNTALLSFILISPRTPESSLLAKNREGIFSFVGYWAIYLTGRQTGLLVCVWGGRTGRLVKTPGNIVETTKWYIHAERMFLIVPYLLVQCAIYALLFWASTSVYGFNLTVSRRLGNLPYVLWIAAYNNAQLAVFALAESNGPTFLFVTPAEEHSQTNATSRIMHSFNKTGLTVFLISNLFTGLVNLTVNTLDMNNVAAIGILIGYSAAVTGIALGLDFAGIKVKV